MLKFFRSIRQKLLANHKIGQYLKYAAGEIILVVLGILIALQINNWNENRKEKAAIKTHLVNLIEDLKSDSITLQQIETSSLFRYHSLQYLLRMAGAKPFEPALDELEVPPFKQIKAWQKPLPDGYNREFIHMAFLWSHRVSFYHSNQSTFSEMKSTGLYSSLQNQDLKNKVNAYYGRWQFTFREIMPELVEEWQQLLEKDGVITSNIYLSKADPIALIKDKPERIAKIHRLLRETGWWVQEANKMRQQGSELIAMIEKVIDKG